MPHRKNSAKLEGEFDQPIYPEMEIELQPTLDSFRAWGIFNELIPELEDSLDQKIDTAILYGSNVNGISTFPDSNYSHESDIDVFLSVDTGNLKDVRNNLDNYMEKEADYEPEINVDIQNKDEINESLEEFLSMDYREMNNHSLPISKPYQHQVNTLERLRAFGDGFIAHKGNKGKTYEMFKQSLDHITDEDGYLEEELIDSYTRNKKERQNYNKLTD